jgi:hypothetical protein
MHPDEVAVGPRVAGGERKAQKGGQDEKEDKSTYVFSSLSAPVVDARTCAKTSELLILSARRWRLRFDQAGVMEPVRRWERGPVKDEH